MKRLPGIYRDIHPDREPVDFGRFRGRRYVKDMPSDLMALFRRVAEARGVSFKKVLRVIAREAVRLMEEWKGGAL